MTACVNFGKAGEAQAVENFWFALTSLEVKEEKQESGEPVKKKVDIQNLMLTSLKYKLGCGGEHAMLSQTHSTGCVLSTLAQRERGHIWSLLHPTTTTTPTSYKIHSQTHTHTQTQQHHITIVNRITGSVTRLCLLTKCILASQSCTSVFSWALTHKHVQDWANKELIDSLQLRQTSQGVIRSGMYIVAVHQVFLEFAVCTKSRLTVLLLPGILHPQPTSLSSPGPQS